MTDTFVKLVQKRQRAPKIKRDQATGSFEGLWPQNDPALLDQAVRWVRAINEIRPVLLEFADSADPMVVSAAGISFAVLESLKNSLLDVLVVDKVALRDATKPLLRAVRLKLGGAAS